MLVVDSSVWIDFFNGARRPEDDTLAELLAGGEARIVVPDLVLFEVLRGFRHEHDHRRARLLMQSLAVEAASDPATALAAAGHYRALRALGFTPRSGIDVLVATFCIEHDHVLLHRDRDFDAFAAHRGLRVWSH